MFFISPVLTQQDTVLRVQIELEFEMVFGAPLTWSPSHLYQDHI